MKSTALSFLAVVSACLSIYEGYLVSGSIVLGIATILIELKGLITNLGALGGNLAEVGLSIVVISTSVDPLSAFSLIAIASCLPALD